MPSGSPNDDALDVADVPADPDAIALEHLQWNALAEHVVSRLSSTAAAAACLDEDGVVVPRRALPRTTQVRSLGRALAQMRGWEVVGSRGAALGLGANVIGDALREVVDISAALERAQHGAVLEVEELCQVADVVAAARAIEELFDAAVGSLESPPEEVAEGLAALGEVRAGLLAPASLAEVLTRSLERGGEPRLSDAASDVLGRLRSGAHKARGAVVGAADRLVKTPTVAKALADRFHTERDGRVVLPVRSDAFSRVGGVGTVSGIIVGSSGSGQTLFVEPAALVELGNAHRQAVAAVRSEERRVLGRLSRQVGEVAEALATSLETLVELDLLSARLRLCQRLEAIEPVLTEAGEDAVLRLDAARHPLMVLSGIDVVPNDIRVAAGAALVISGPNAGGKTVALKTTGLLALMATAGLRLPTQTPASMPVFERILTDVGDDQSIAGGLSTFSAHIGHVMDALEAAAEAGSAALVLLDEVAVGTEPEQGAALAEAILAGLVERGAATVCTTHYERLKLLATAEPTKYANASVGFDFDAMRPTFTVRIGTPGPSSALIVARRLGMPAAVLTHAESLIEDTRLQVDALLREVEAERERLRAERAELEAATERIARRERALEEKQKKAEQTASGRRQKAHEAALASLRDLDNEIKRRRKALRKAGLPNLGSDGVTDPQDRQFARDARSELTASRPRGAEGPAESPAEITIGQRVRVEKLGADGEVVEVKGDKVTVQLPLAKMTVSRDELSLPSKSSKAGRGGQAAKKFSKEPTVKMGTSPAAHFGAAAQPVQARHDNVLDCRGERVADVETMVEVFLDRAISDDCDVVIIRHGHGTGALRKVIRERLAGLAHVAKHRPGLAPEGGDAVTVVWIRL